MVAARNNGAVIRAGGFTQLTLAGRDDRGVAGDGDYFKTDDQND